LEEPVAKSKKRPAKRGTRTSARRRARNARSSKKARKVELRPIRRQLEAHKKTLRGAEQTMNVKKALRRIERCLAEIRGICGADMSVPLA
jgi:hypothetical protein